MKDLTTVRSNGTIPRDTTIRISGLDCADCAAKLEKRIQAIPGVETARVNFGAAKLDVTHRGSIAELMQIIEELGYSGTLEGAKANDQPRSAFWKTNRYARSTIVSGTIISLAIILQYLVGLPESIVHPIYLIGIILGSYLPAKSGLAMLLRARELDMNTLMMLAVLGAVAIGQLEEGAVVVFLFSLGNALQGYTLDKTRNSIRALMELTPNEALVRRNNQEMMLPVEAIRLDDTVIVRPGERIPMDGRVVRGASTVNQAPITGESLPVDKQPGDEVFAGTINEQGALEIAVTKLAKDNTLARIIHLVEEAQGQRAPSQQFIDKFARYYTPLVIMAAALVAIIPPLAFNQPFNRWFYEALAMLLVACPCALVISTPVSIASAISSAARNGVLIKGGAYLEEIGNLSAIAFDKTGTLTQGKPQVTDILPLNGSSREELLTLASAIESRSGHPLGEAIVNYAKEQGISFPSVTRFEAVLGKGAQGEVYGRKYFIGKVGFFQERGISLDKAEAAIYQLQQEGKTAMVLGDEEKILGLIAVADGLKNTSRAAIEQLKKTGLKKVVMLTGDNERTARAIASNLGVDEVKADLLPKDKAVAIKKLMAEHAKVAMVGDGVNDAPALASATVGIAMGAAGTDTALETADIALMTDDLSKLPYTINLSRRTQRIIKQNIVLSLAIKGVILLLVIPGWLTLWLAIVGDMGSSLLVTLNGMRLLGDEQPQGRFLWLEKLTSKSL
ncbi:MAG: cadmium-translocating P-type ATPase [Syntrophomonadaceae bacterium]|nr:cadmium-translocating P-type ATPase [Syntrophomonadaceae bacterium]